MDTMSPRAVTNRDNTRDGRCQMQDRDMMQGYGCEGKQCTFCAAASSANSTKTEPRKSLLSMWRRMRTELRGALFWKKSVMASREVLKGKGDA